MKIIAIIIASLSLLSCKGSPDKTADIPTSPKEIKFEMISIPDSLTTVESRGEYFLEHYWDNFPFADTAYVDVPKVSEQAYVDYIDVLNYMPIDQSVASIRSTMEKAQAHPMMFDYFVQLAEKYLYHPNSPLRNEDYFIAVLRSELASTVLSDDEKIRPQFQLDVALKNRVSEPANDFIYTLQNGSQGTLYGIRSPYTLVYFNSPECPNCIQVKEQIQSSHILSNLISQGKIKVLSIFTDEDISLWKKHIAEQPKQWINAYDRTHTISDSTLYDLRAIPSMYLLDKDKKVLLKDVDFEGLEKYKF